MDRELFIHLDYYFQKHTFMKIFYFLCFAFFAASLLNSCSTTGGSTKCPNMASRHIQHPALAHRNYSLPKQSKTTAQKDDGQTIRKQYQAPILAFLKQELPVNTQLPAYMQSEIEASGNFEKVNDALSKYSNNKVFLARNNEGKMIVKATEFKALAKVTQQIVFKKPAQRMSDTARDVLALVGGILGIVSISTSWIPFFNFLSIFIGVGGLVLGILGLKSENRRKWALLGIILGSIGIALSITFILIYAFLWFYWI